MPTCWRMCFVVVVVLLLLFFLSGGCEVYKGIFCFGEKTTDTLRILVLSSPSPRMPLKCLQVGPPYWG